MEIKGRQINVGSLQGNSSEDACFSYAKEYMETSGHYPISISLPFQEEAFTQAQTRNFFEGLLPEGFTRRCVAEWIHVDSEDYLSILSSLGCECLGAVKITEDGKPPVKPGYKRLSLEEVRSLAREGATESAQMVIKSHLSLTGASGKVGLYYDGGDGQWYLPIGEAPSTHIVKQSHVRLEGIVTNEQLCLLAAGELGIETPESFVVDTGGGQDKDILFATKRYDRVFGDAPCFLAQLPLPFRLHQEDFAQAMGISAAAKYEHNQEGYLQKMFRLLRAYSSDPLRDQLKLWDMAVYNYLIGNTDNHIKNFSLLYGSNLKSVHLAPAYDVVSTAVYESSTKEMAMGIGGAYMLDRISRKNFEEEARNVGIGVNLAMKRFDILVSGFEKALKRAAIFLASQGFVKAESICEDILENGGFRYL